MRRNPPIPFAGLAVACAVACAVVFLTACSRHSDPDSGSRDAPCVLLLTLDSLRADHLGAYGGTNTFTPVLDGLSKGGARLDDLQAVAPLSLTAHASILTGLQPPEHGLRVPGVGTLPKTVTLASALRAAGYRTGAFVANPELTEDRGLDEGFERYDLPPPGGAVASGRSIRSTSRLRPRAFAQPPHAGTRRGEEVADAALAWLAEVTGAPKKPSPASIADRRGANDAAGAPAATPPVKPLHPKQPFFLWVQLSDAAFRDSPEHTQVGGSRNISTYDAELAYMDLQVGRILAFINTHGLRDRTLVVVVGSHGLDLGTNAGADAGLVLSDGTLHVPGILNWTGKIPQGTQLAATVNQTVLAPTIAELAGFGSVFGAPTSTRSVAGPLLGGPAPAPLPAYVETLWPRHAYGLPALTGWTDADWRFVAGRGVLPRRTVNTAAAPAADGAAATLAGIEATFRAVGTTQPPPTPAAEAVFTLPAGWDRGEFVALWQRVALRMRHPSAADETLLADCRRLVEGRPGYAPFHTWLGIAHSLHKQLAEAVVTQRRALELAPGTPHILSNLGLAYLDASDIPKAIDKLEDAYLARQDDPEFRDNLAAVLMHTGVALAKNKAFNDAMACMTRVLLLQPDNPVAHVNMGSVYQGMGRNDLATASYRRALELSPGFTPAKRALEALKEPQ